MIRVCLAMCALLVILPGAGGLVAQELKLERNVPLVWEGCPGAAGQPATAPTREQQQEAERLAAAATQSAILGDNAAAFDELQRAAVLDPSSHEIAYQLARTLQDLGRTQDALAAYCRYTTIGGDAPEIRDVHERIAALAATTVTAAAAREFKTGIAHFDAGRHVAAEAAFTQAMSGAPSWPAPLYNRAVVRLALGRRDAASADAQSYVRLGGDPAQVAGLVAVAAAAESSSNAGTALVAGLVVPGLGHFVTDRPAMGALVLGAAGAAVAVGLGVKRTKVDCLSPPVDGECPADQVVRERSERPYLVPAIGVAALAGVLGAVDAYRAARRPKATAGSLRTGARNDTRSTFLALSEIHVDLHEVRVELVRLRF